MILNFRVHFRNLIASWGGRAAYILVAFFLSPFVVHTLGDVRYGIWSLILSVVGYMGMADVGLRRSISKHLNQYLAHNESQRAMQVVSTSLAILSLVGIAIIISAYVMGRLFHLIFPDVPTVYMTEVQVVLLLASMELLLSLIGSVFRRAAEAFERFDLVNIIGVGRLMLRTGGVVGVLLLSPTLIGLATVSLVSAGLEAIALAVLAHRVWLGLRISPSLCSKDRARELRNFGLPAFFDNISKRIINHTALVIIGVFLTVPLVTIYSIGLMVVTYAREFLIQIVTVLTPEIFKKTALGDRAASQDLLIRSANATAFACVPILVGFIFFAEEFIRLWMGPTYVMSARVMQILAFSTLVMTFGYPSETIILGCGRAGLAAMTSAIEATLNFSLGVFLLKVFNLGIIGVALGTLIPAILIEGIWRPVLACRMIALPVGQFFVKAMLRWAITGFFFSTICMVAKTFPAVTWSGFFLIVSAVATLYIPVGWYGLFDKEARRAMRLSFSTT